MELQEDTSLRKQAKCSVSYNIEPDTASCRQATAVVFIQLMCKPIVPNHAEAAEMSCCQAIGLHTAVSAVFYVLPALHQE